MMKILLIIKNFDLGGTEVNVCQLANSLSSLGHEVHVASKKGRQVGELNQEVIHHEFKFSELYFIPNYLRLSAIVKRERIMLIHGNQRMAISFAALLSMRHRIPSVGTVHGQFKRDLRSSFIRKILHCIIIVAPNRLDNVRINTELQKKIKVIYNSIPLPDRLDVRETMEKLRLVCVSRIDKRHGFFLEKFITEVMPTILKKHDHVELQIIGDGSHFQRIRELRDGLSEERLKKSITMMGYQSNPIVMMSKAHVVIGVGRVAIESLSVNTPVISANATFCGGLVTLENYEQMKSNNFVARYADPFSADILISSLSNFIENQGGIQMNHLPLSDRARDDFSNSKMIKEIITLYESLIKKN